MSAANMDRARAAWGQRPPDWVLALASACDAASQGKVAKRLGISPAVVNQVIGNAYTGRMDRAEVRVRGELMNSTLNCPVLGDLSTRQCLDNQARPFSTTSRLATRLSLACPKCPHREQS